MYQRFAAICQLCVHIDNDDQTLFAVLNSIIIVNEFNIHNQEMKCMHYCGKKWSDEGKQFEVV